MTFYGVETKTDRPAPSNANNAGWLLRRGSNLCQAIAQLVIVGIYFALAHPSHAPAQQFKPEEHPDAQQLRDAIKGINDLDDFLSGLSKDPQKTLKKAYSEHLRQRRIKRAQEDRKTYIVPDAKKYGVPDTGRASKGIGGLAPDLPTTKWVSSDGTVYSRYWDPIGKKWRYAKGEVEQTAFTVPIKKLKAMFYASQPQDRLDFLSYYLPYFFDKDHSAVLDAEDLEIWNSGIVIDYTLFDIPLTKNDLWEDIKTIFRSPDFNSSKLKAMIAAGDNPCEEIDAVTLSKVNERLIRDTESASPIASLLSSLVSLNKLPQNEKQGMMDCLCKQAAGKSTSVSVTYKPKPERNDCGKKTAGPCLWEGLGCGRLPLIVSAEALEFCQLPKSVAKAICRMKAGLEKRD